MTGAGTATRAFKQRAVAAAGSVARHVPIDQVQLFAFVASDRVRADPWALYQRLHKRGPVRPGPMGVWLVASHAGVDAVLRRAVTTVDETRAVGVPGGGDRSGPFSTLIERTLLFTDPPAHTRLRRLVSRSFTPRRVAALRGHVEELVDRALDDLRPQGAADLVEDFALPFPVAVISELLGVPERERPRFVAWARHLGPRLDIDLFRDEERERLGDRAATELSAFLRDLIRDPARRDPDGLLSALCDLDGGDDLDAGDEPLTEDEIVALCALLLVAGFETTTNLIANSVLALLHRPADLAALRDGRVDPEVAVEELLRHDGPVQFTQRVLLEDFDVDGRTIPAGTLTALLIGAANRDPLVFDRPDALRLDRQPNPHLAFSSGIHHCLGASLARLEAAVAIPALLRKLPDLRLAGPPDRRSTFVLRGLTRLPVRWQA